MKLFLPATLVAALLLVSCGSDGGAGGVPPTIDSAPASVPTGRVDEAFEFSLEASGEGTMTWSIVAGELPPGIELDGATGRIRGTPTDHGQFPVWIELRSATGRSQRQFVLQVAAPPPTAPSIAETTLPDATAELSYAHLILADGTPPRTWSLQTGNLPPGLQLGQTTGAITGTPTNDGNYTFTVLMSAPGGVDTQELSLEVLEAPIGPIISAPSGALPGATLASVYSTTPTADGSSPITWRVIGNLPPGLALNEVTGEISGTPVSIGDFGFTLRADNLAGFDTVTTSISVAAVPLITSLSPDTAAAGSNIDILGSGFSSTPSENTVMFDDTEATALAATATSLTVAVPPTLDGQYEVSLSVDGTAAANTAIFTAILLETLYVDTDAEGTADGSSWTDAYTDLSEALLHAEAGDEVWVAAGNYSPGNSPGDTFTVPTGVSLFGGFAGGEGDLSERDVLANPTILDGDVQGDDTAITLSRPDNNDSLLTCGANVTISGFTIRGANDTAIRTASNGTLTLTRNRFTDNKSTANGAILDADGLSSLSVHDCVFDSNRVAASGACMDLSNILNVDIARSVLDQNVSSSDGVLRVSGCVLQLRDSLIINNQTTTGCAALSLHDNNDIVISGCTLARNSGPIADLSISEPIGSTARVTLENSILESSCDCDNIRITEGDPVLSIAHCMLEGGLLAIRNDGIGSITDEGGNLEGDPQFVDSLNPAGLDGVYATSDDGFRLDPGSPCIDTGRSPTNSTTDLSHNTRTVGEAPDLGAYEVQEN